MTDEIVLARGNRCGSLGPRRLLEHVGVLVLVLLLACVAAASELAGAVEEGTAAYRTEDYETALRLWRPLAEAGNAEAQEESRPSL